MLVLVDKLVPKTDYSMGNHVLMGKFAASPGWEQIAGLRPHKVSMFILQSVFFNCSDHLLGRRQHFFHVHSWPWARSSQHV